MHIRTLWNQFNFSPVLRLRLLYIVIIDLILKSVRVIDRSIPWRLNHLRNYAATNGTRTCIYDCIRARWTCRYPQRTYTCTNTRVQAVSCDQRPLISSTPFCGRASSTKNYVAHHGKRKVKPSERPRHTSLFLIREIIETSNYADREKNVKYKYGLDVRLLTFSIYIYIFLFLWAECSLIEARFNYRRSIATLRVRSRYDR